VLDYFIQVEEADELAKLTMQPPSYPPAPRLLVLYNRLKRWNALPVAGGFLSQPAYLMLALDVVEDAVSERISAGLGVSRGQKNA